MKTLLYLGAGLDLSHIHDNYDRIIYTDVRPANNLNDHLLDDFVSQIKTHGFRAKMNRISYVESFLVKCYNDTKFIKYYFNTFIPHKNMLEYEKLDTVYVNIDADLDTLLNMLKPFVNPDCKVILCKLHPSSTPNNFEYIHGDSVNVH